MKTDHARAIRHTMPAMFLPAYHCTRQDFLPIGAAFRVPLGEALIAPPARRPVLGHVPCRISREGRVKPPHVARPCHQARPHLTHVRVEVAQRNERMRFSCFQQWRKITDDRGVKVHVENRARYIIDLDFGPPARPVMLQRIVSRHIGIIAQTSKFSLRREPGALGCETLDMLDPVFRACAADGQDMGVQSMFRSSAFAYSYPA